MACREEELPEAGRFIVYEVVGQSLLIVRRPTAPSGRSTTPACIAAASCSPRTGTSRNSAAPSMASAGSWTAACARSRAAGISITSASRLRLPEARVGTWGGFVFVNLDDKAIPLEQFLGVLPRALRALAPGGLLQGRHVAKVIDCNWKVAQEAFMESYHVIATHPQILPIIADANSQYDIYGRHVNRNLAAFAAPSPHLGAGWIRSRSSTTC